MNKVEATWIVNERVDNIYNDLKSFVYIRIHSLQHGQDNIGGGNITAAIALFAVLNFLGKIQYYLDKGSSTPIENNEPRIVEEVAFIHLVKKLSQYGINLGLPNDNNQALKLVWNGFRNKLSHVGEVEGGKQVTMYVINDIAGNLTVSNFLTNLKDKQAFNHDGQYRKWTLNADVLLAKLPEIKSVITKQINTFSDTLDYNLLRKIIG